MNTSASPVQLLIVSETERYIYTLCTSNIPISYVRNIRTNHFKSIIYQSLSLFTDLVKLLTGARTYSLSQFGHISASLALDKFGQTAHWLIKIVGAHSSLNSGSLKTSRLTGQSNIFHTKIRPANFLGLKRVLFYFVESELMGENNKRTTCLEHQKSLAVLYYNRYKKLKKIAQFFFEYL